MDVENLGDDVPEGVKTILDAVDLVDLGSNATEHEQHMYERIENGHCMLCNAELGSTTTLIINARGVLMVFCGGACFSDMQVMGWLMEKYDDLVDQVKFRGGEGDTAPD